MKKPKPLMTAQQFRAVNAIRAALAKKLGFDEAELQTVYKPRLCQVVGFEGHEVSEKGNQSAISYKLAADAAIYRVSRELDVFGDPVLVVFLDRDCKAYQLARQKLREKRVNFIFSKEIEVLKGNIRIDIPISERSKASAKEPYNAVEKSLLTRLLDAQRSGQLPSDMMVTGQVELGPITYFRGFKDGRNPTDIDLLICTEPPVSFPLLAIEVDGPTHYCAKFWQESRNADEVQAKRRIEKEKSKARQKDVACLDAEIPLIRVRVNDNDSNVFQDSVDVIVAVISAAVCFMKDAHKARKSWIYVTSIAGELESIQDEFVSRFPELEDAVRLTPELLKYLIGRIDELEKEIQQRSENSCGNGFDENDAFSTDQLEALEQHYSYEEYDKISAADSDGLLKWLNFELTSSVAKESWGRLYGIKVSFRPMFGDGVTLHDSLCSGPFLLPWFEVKGFRSAEIDSRVREELRGLLAARMLFESGPEQLEEWRAAMLEHISSVVGAKVDASFLRDIRECYEKEGVKGLVRRIERSLSVAACCVLIERGYVSERPKEEDAKHCLFKTLVWVHESVPKPPKWNDQARYDRPYAEVREVLESVDDVTKQKSLRSIDSRIRSMLEAYRSIDVSAVDITSINKTIRALILDAESDDS